MIRYPKPLPQHAHIAVTAPSSGVAPAAHRRLDNAIAYLTDLGYQLEEGETLRNQYKSASASAAVRGRELMHFLLHDEVDALIPPWGGELAIELLPLIDFERLAQVEPKWFLGFSDISTLLLPLTLLAGWATAHGPNLMSLCAANDNPLERPTLQHLATPHGGCFRQTSSTRYQSQWPDGSWTEDTCYRLDTPTRYRLLDGAAQARFSGRLIGGCLDVLSPLAGSRYGDVPGFIRRHREEGVIVYLENAEATPCAVARMLYGLRLAGWFDGVAGVILGRSAGPDATSDDALSYDDAVGAALGGLPCPVVLDADVGHVPPQWLLINGAYAEVEVSAGQASIVQRLA